MMRYLKRKLVMTCFFVCCYVIFSTFIKLQEIKNNITDDINNIFLNPIGSLNEDDIIGDISNFQEPTINCGALLKGDPYEQFKAKMMVKASPKVITPDEEIANLAKNCSVYKRIKGYLKYNVSRIEQDFPIAYSVLIHENIEQVELLLRTIYRPHNVYCIHIDAKAAPSVHNAMKTIANCFENVFIASKLETIIYAGFARLQADLNCMTDLLRRKEKWKYFMNLVGRVFPLKTNLEMVKVLKIYNGANDIEGIRLNRYLKGRLEISYVNVYPPNRRPYLRRTKITKGPPPHDIQIVKGSAYGIFSRKFVDFILNDAKARDLLQWSRDTLTPDEHYWSTLHHLMINPQLHSPGGYIGAVDKKPWLAVYAAWPPRDPCHGKRVRGVCVFGLEDLPLLITRREFFANKFMLEFDPVVIQCMAEWIKDKTVHPPEIDVKFYEDLSFVRFQHTSH